jgi:predicted ATP-binding protein involved in virulence
MSSEANDIFRIDRMTVRNFRGFEERTFAFSDECTVLIGDNGAGKTAALDALALGLTLALRELGAGEHRTVEADDVRQVAYPTKGLPYTEPQFPLELVFGGVVYGEGKDWRWLLKGPEDGMTETGLQPMPPRDDRVQPLIAFYGSERFAPQPAESLEDLVGKQPRTYGYVDCLQSGASERHFMRWFKTMELVSLQEGSPLPALAAVKQAITDSLEDCEDVTYVVKHDELMITLRDGRVLPFRMLSSGQRSMLALVADMAWRASFLNPQFEADAAAQTPGVVLIDEIDVHLHPAWQRLVVNDLRRTFPAIQFIATTHSPFIVQSLRPGELLKLDDPAPGEYADKPIEDIAENVMGIEIPQRSERHRRMMQAAEEYYALLRRGKDADPTKKAELKARLDELAEPFSDDVAYQALLRSERKAAGLGGDES